MVVAEAAEVAEAVEAAKPIRDSAEEAPSNEMESQAEEVKDKANENGTVQDEFCSNKSFDKLIDEELVENILVTADGVTML